MDTSEPDKIRVKRRIISSDDYSILILLAVALFLTVPFIIKGFPQCALDGWIHCQWSYHFANQFWAGELYPRWLVEVNGGLGSPAFYFYHPVPYFITSILRIISPDIFCCYRTLGFSVAVGLILSGVFCFKLMRRYTSATVAALASASYLLVPYHLVEDIYQRSAFAEFWAITWLPLVFYYADKVINGDKISIAKLGFSYALLIMSHLPTTLITSPFLGFYSLVLPQGSEKSKYFIRTVLGLLLGIGISAVYLIPALTLQWAVSMHELTSPGFYYKYHFFFTHDSDHQKYKKELLILIMSMVIVGVAGGVVYLLHPNNNKGRKIVLFWLFAVVFCFFMMTPLSNPIWKYFWVLQIIQFPFRYGTLLSIAVVILLGFGISQIKESFSIKTGIIAILLWAIIVGWMYFDVTSIWKHMTWENNYIMPPIQREVPEYRPRWASQELQKNLEMFVSEDNKINKIVFAENNPPYYIEKWSSRHMIFNVLLTGTNTAYALRYYFPGIKVKVNGNDHPFEISSPQGVIKIPLTAGRQRVEIIHLKTIQEIIGALLSVLCIISCVVFILRCSKNQNVVK